MTEQEAYEQACFWVHDQIEKTTCISDDEATLMAAGFVTGLLHGMRKGSLGEHVIQGPTAEAFWRGNWDQSLAFEREKILVDDQPEIPSLKPGDPGFTWPACSQCGSTSLRCGCD
jgi:hypothetical protein